MALIYMEISIVSKDFNLGLVLAHITLKETSEWLFLSEYQEETIEIRFESTGTKRKYNHVRDGNDDQYANVTAQGITCFFPFPAGYLFSNQPRPPGFYLVKQMGTVCPVQDILLHFETVTNCTWIYAWGIIIYNMGCSATRGINSNRR